MKLIRGKAIIIFEHECKYLFTVCYEQTAGKIFYIPVGGGIEFGEYSIDAAKREVLEEIGQETENVQLLEIIENIFTYNGIKEHEIVFVYKAEFTDKRAYHSKPEACINDNGNQIKLIWAGIDEIKNQGINVYPSSLLDLLQK